MLKSLWKEEHVINPKRNQFKQIRRKLRRLGRKAEKVFIDAWRDVSLRPEWMKEVKKADGVQDQLEKTDAIITNHAGEEFRIQIKLGRIKDNKRLFYFSQDIVILQIDPKWSGLFIRHQTLEALESYMAFLDSRRFETGGKDPLLLLEQLSEIAESPGRLY